METILLRKDYTLLYILLALVYLAGLSIPLMQNDSAQHAVMAMRMYLENDFLNIYKGGEDYLDKPHMHFWLAALSFKIFGISQWAYRIPALLFTLMGAMSCYYLAKELYGKKASHIAALVFLSAQAIILSNHDVRTDAVLTGATIFSIWQLILYARNERLSHIVLGAIGVGIAFSTKGQLGVFMVGVCCLCYLLYQRKWNALWNWKAMVGLLVFFASILPVLYAYYLQFDLHPEKIINGMKNISGVRFILWDQSFNRLTASGFEKTSPDYLFFFHTFLWAFLPWSIIAYLALFSKIKTLFKTGFKYGTEIEIFSSIGFLIIMCVISFSKFKLPHYINSLLPIVSILVSAYLVRLHVEKQRTAQILLIVQYIVLTLASLIVIYLIFFTFTLPYWSLILCYVLLIIGLVLLVKSAMNVVRKLVVVSVYFMIFINFCLNTHFYPSLLKYQAGNNAAGIIDEEEIDPNAVFILPGRPSWSLDFYTRRITPILDLGAENLKKPEKEIWVFLYENQLSSLKSRNITWQKKYDIDHYRITRLSASFLNPKTRESVLEKAYLIQL